LEINDFGVVFAPIMVVAHYQNEKWSKAKIVPYDDIKIPPSIMGLHYGLSIFEGMKAHKSPHGDVIIFRIYDHFKRFNRSAERMMMPQVPEDIFVHSMIEALRQIKEWVPEGFDKSMYIRPFMFATDPIVKIKFPTQFMFMILFSPSAMYYTRPVSLLVEEHYARAVEGGTGNIKCGGNYGASLYPHKLAVSKGFDQVLWTDAKTHTEIEEVGTMNIFLVCDGVVYTPPLDRGTILPGITRDSVITILKDWGIEVREQSITVQFLIESARKGTLTEMFGSGTAATITPISSFSYKGEKYELPPVTQNSLSMKLKDALDKIKFGIEVPEKYKHWLTIV